MGLLTFTSQLRWLKDMERQVLPQVRASAIFNNANSWEERGLQGCDKEPGAENKHQRLQYGFGSTQLRDQKPVSMAADSDSSQIAYYRPAANELLLLWIPANNIEPAGPLHS